MDLTILTYRFMQNALLAGFFGGIACSLIGVYVVTMSISLIGVAISHAAFAGALLGVWLGFNPLIGALIFSLTAAFIIGPIADKGELKPDTSIGIVFSLTMGLAFLFMGMVEGPKTAALDFLWGSILTVRNSDLWLLGAAAFFIMLIVIIFHRWFQAVTFNRDLALSTGIPAKAVFYCLLLMTGFVITVSLKSIGGLLIFNLIINPAASAFQITYDMKKMYLLASVFGVGSCWSGLIFSYILNAPSGATIVITSALVFLACTALSPKRRTGKLLSASA